MATITEQQARNMLQLLEDASTPVITIDDFKFTETGTRNSPACTILYKEEPIIRKDFDRILPRDIITLLDIPSVFNKSEDVEEHLEWEHLNDTQYLREWQTPFDHNRVYIKVNAHKKNKSFEVHAPVEDRSTWLKYGNHRVQDVATDFRKFEQLESAFVYVVNYMYMYNPYEVDKLLRMEEIAKQQFLDITGVGEKTVEEIVTKNHIRTYEGLKNNMGAISRNYRKDAKKELEARITTGKSISDYDYVKEVSAKLAATNI